MSHYPLHDALLVVLAAKEKLREAKQALEQARVHQQQKANAAYEQQVALASEARDAYMARPNRAIAEAEAEVERAVSTLADAKAAQRRIKTQYTTNSEAAIPGVVNAR